MLNPAPASLGSPLLMPEFGRYYGAIADTDTSAFDREGRRRWQRKGWLFTGVFTDDWQLGFAIADAGYLGLAFTYFFERSTGRYLEEKIMRPFAFPRDFPASLRGSWQLGNRSRNWRIDPEMDDWRFRFEGKRLHCDLMVRHRFVGLTAIAPSPGRPFNCTYKLAGADVEGSLTVDGKSLTTMNAVGVLDHTLGYPPRNTHWNWACLAGTTGDGRRLGVNLVAHFNDGLENALWLDGTVHPLAQAQFVVPTDKRRSSWHIDTADDILELDFLPEGARAENVRLGLVESRFIQPFGRFRGTIRLDGERVPITGYGIVEDHRARW